MIPSKTYLERFDRARKIMATLSASEKRFNNCVRVIHQDDSIFVLNFAFIAIDEKDWFAVICEHHDVHIFHKEDLHDWAELKYKKR